MKQQSRKFVRGPFYAQNAPLSNGPWWGMTLRAAGSMRFRWNEVNENRFRFFNDLCGGDRELAQVELIHSHTVFSVEHASELEGQQGDGIITTNHALLPVVTVADCMPIFLYEPAAGVFGVLHSGWRGTGIVRDAIERAEKVYGARRERFSVVLGPHIRSCCYTVDEERAQYFRVNFTPDCVTEIRTQHGIFFPGDRKKGEPVAVEQVPPARDLRYRLSLAKANLSLLKELGVNEDNIAVSRDCTCCNSTFGSFRRETIGLPRDMPLAERQKHFTVQAAWVMW
ncbi:MAG: polyphenol oxidase family protein [Treponema sp.]|nr:polyphenol oxidase family protein [Treponema sp.]